MKEEDRARQIAALSKQLRKRKYFSIMLALFTLGVNIFAWFAFSANVGLTLDATVASWSVNFKDNNDVVVRNVVVEVTKMKPGMSEFTSTVTVENDSDVEADFDYEITSLSILGNVVNIASQANVFQYLSTYYPFAITFTTDKMSLIANDSLHFTAHVTWPFENSSSYYAQNNVYQFDDTFIYYTRSGSTYTPTTVANSTAFLNNIDNLYLQKDDADSYFGMRCNEYETNTGSACLVLTMKLLVTQAADD